MKGIAPVALALILAGCGRFGPLKTEDALSTWQRMPLAPDPGMSEAARTDPVCNTEHLDGLQIVLQDRRTASTAAFLTAAVGYAGSCLLSFSGGGSGGGGRSAPLDPLTGALSVDENASGGAGSGTATLLGGRIRPGVERVIIEIVGGDPVVASVGNGHWLAWWPGGLSVARIVAFDSSGAEVGSITDTTPGFEQK